MHVDPAAALDALARATSWEGAYRLYFAAVPGAGRADAENAFHAAAERGWLLSALPELRLLIEAWQAVGRIQSDAQRARYEAERHRLPDDVDDYTPMDRAQLATAFAKCNDSALRGESIGLSALATVQRCLDRWRRACVAFARLHAENGPQFIGHEDWRRACSTLLKLSVAEGDLQMALSLVGRIEDPDALQIDDLDPLVQARRQQRHLESAAERAARVGDGAALVALASARIAATERVALLQTEPTVAASDDVRAAEAALAADIDRDRA